MKSILKGIGALAIIIFVCIIYLNQEKKNLELKKKYDKTIIQVNQLIDTSNKTKEENKKLHEALDKKKEELIEVVAKKDDEIAKVHYLSDKEIRELEKTNKTWEEKYVILKKNYFNLSQKIVLLEEQVENYKELLLNSNEKIRLKDLELEKCYTTIKKLYDESLKKDKLFMKKTGSRFGLGGFIGAGIDFNGKPFAGAGIGIIIKLKRR